MFDFKKKHSEEEIEIAKKGLLQNIFNLFGRKNKVLLKDGEYQIENYSSF